MSINTEGIEVFKHTTYTEITPSKERVGVLRRFQSEKNKEFTNRFNGWSMNYLNWDMQFMLRIAAAASIRVSNELGAGHPRVAQLSVIIVNATSAGISILFSTIVLIFKVGLSNLFTSDSQVIEVVSDLTPLLAISVFLNGMQPVLSGVDIGSGWQAVVAYINLATYYIIGLPIGCILGFKTNLEVAGIWWGMIIGVVLQTLLLFVITARTNWTSEVAKAADRLKESAEEQLHLEENI